MRDCRYYLSLGRQIEAFAAAKAAGQGVAVVDGRIVENLHIVTAEAIAAMTV